MPGWLSIVIGVLCALVALWLVLLALLWWTSRRLNRRLDLRATLRLVPDVLVLVRDLARDRSLPRRVRWGLYGLLAYLLLPIDLVPDVIPVLGYADDAVVTILVLRWVLRTAGEEVVRAQWRGSDEGLEAVLALAGRPSER
ncbi:YkvA family protein [Galactobacter valiniphilus]|uniref:YkvA family protein n=1 Tax=Galactobacter valiniphilus TaxID=2676122 RepID=UPI00373703D1